LSDPRVTDSTVSLDLGLGVVEVEAYVAAGTREEAEALIVTRIESAVRSTTGLSNAIRQLRSRERLGFSEALNRLARAGAAVVGSVEVRQPFIQPTVELGVLVDVSNIAEVLDVGELDDDRCCPGRWNSHEIGSPVWEAQVA